MFNSLWCTKGKISKRLISSTSSRRRETRLSCSTGSTPLDIEGFQLAVVLSKAVLLHELLNVWIGLPAGKCVFFVIQKQNNKTSNMLPRYRPTSRWSPPHRHPGGRRRRGTRCWPPWRTLSWSHMWCSEWGWRVQSCRRGLAPSNKVWAGPSGLRRRSDNFEMPTIWMVGRESKVTELEKLTFAPRLRVSRSVELGDDTNSSETGKLNHHLYIGRRVHVGVRVVSSLRTRGWQLVSNTGSLRHASCLATV